jgi:hypothetical protein
MATPAFVFSELREAFEDMQRAGRRPAPTFHHYSKTPGGFIQRGRKIVLVFSISCPTIRKKGGLTKKKRRFASTLFSRLFLSLHR